VPALVPPGFTRGPLLFMGTPATELTETVLLQRFWTEAGSYGARILIVPTATTAQAAEHYVHLFNTWEAAAVNVLTIASRKDAQQSHDQTLFDHATGILILDGNPLQFVSLLGGTPVAQAIRRANAHGKAVAGLGRGASLLCQHMIAFEQPSENSPAFLHRRLVQFAPGLGLINRLVLDVANVMPDNQSSNYLPRTLSTLLTAVAYNPFLIGLGLEPSVGVVVYPDSTLEVFGEGSILVIDGAGMSYTNVHEYQSETPISLLGVQLHVLGRGYMFSLDERTVHQPTTSDIPTTALPDQSRSPF
jgi:cyanophycinase